jgi:hypothetical protein
LLGSCRSCVCILTIQFVLSNVLMVVCVCFFSLLVSCCDVLRFAFVDLIHLQWDPAPRSSFLEKVKSHRGMCPFASVLLTGVLVIEKESSFCLPSSCDEHLTIANTNPENGITRGS